MSRPRRPDPTVIVAERLALVVVLAVIAVAILMHA